MVKSSERRAAVCSECTMGGSDGGVCAVRRGRMGLLSCAAVQYEEMWGVWLAVIAAEDETAAAAEAQAA